MHPTYLQSNLHSQGAILARGALDVQLKELLDANKLLCELVEKSHEEIDKRKTLIFIAQIFLGGSYEVIRSFLGSYRVAQVKRDYPHFNFLYHCRNASFHGNQFDFTINGRPVEVGQAIWQSYTITKTDQGKTLFPDKLRVEKIIPLLKDISKLF